MRRETASHATVIRSLPKLTVMLAMTTATSRIGGSKTLDVHATIRMRQRLVATAFGGFRPWNGVDEFTSRCDIESLDIGSLDIDSLDIDATSDRHLHRPSATGYGHRP